MALQSPFVQALLQGLPAKPDFGYTSPKEAFWDVLLAARACLEEAKLRTGPDCIISSLAELHETVGLDIDYILGRRAEDERFSAGSPLDVATIQRFETAYVLHCYKRAREDEDFNFAHWLFEPEARRISYALTLVGEGYGAEQAVKVIYDNGLLRQGFGIDIHAPRVA
ncbi:MAG: hypothetical protein WC043_00680 [Pseudobdellovibrionaceae bacterium]